MERFHGNGLKNLNSAVNVILKIIPPKKKFGARGWHKDLRVFPENLSSIGPEINILKSNKVWEKISECTV